LTENVIVRVVGIIIELHVEKATARNKHSRSLFHFYHFQKFIVRHRHQISWFHRILTDFLHALVNVLDFPNVHNKRITGYVAPSVRDVRLIPKLSAQNYQMQMNVKIICFRVERIFKRAEITFDVIFENLFPLEVSERLFQLRQTTAERRRVLRRQSEKTQPPFISLHRFGYFRFCLST
jgi:hypothetical protein